MLSSVEIADASDPFRADCSDVRFACAVARSDSNPAISNAPRRLVTLVNDGINDEPAPNNSTNAAFAVSSAPTPAAKTSSRSALTSVIAAVSSSKPSDRLVIFACARVSKVALAPVARAAMLLLAASVISARSATSSSPAALNALSVKVTDSKRPRTTSISVSTALRIWVM